MRLHRFYIKTPIKNNTFDVTDKELINQWKNVFRYNVGSQVIVFDGDGIDYLCIISSLRSASATLGVIQEMKKVKQDKNKNIWLCVGLTKKDNFEVVVQKGTELGVDHFVPVLCERTEKKNINKERVEKISIEATEQSGRGDVPFIHDVINPEDLISSNLLPNTAIYLDFSGKNIKEVVKEGGQKDIAVFIGPEGGWSPKEIDLFKTYNIIPVSIGDSVLRSETAAIAVSSILLI